MSSSSWSSSGFFVSSEMPARPGSFLAGFACLATGVAGLTRTAGFLMPAAFCMIALISWRCSIGPLRFFCLSSASPTRLTENGFVL